MDLEDLVRAAQRGEPLALAALLRALAPYVGRICGAIALDDGDDAMQETMIRVLKGIRRLREPAALHGWVRRIAVREALRLARTRSTLIPVEQLPEPLAGIAPDLRVEVAGTLRQLTPEQRAILMRSRTYLVGMAAEPLGERTRYAHLEGLPYHRPQALRLLRPVFRGVVGGDIRGIVRTLVLPRRR
jgi:DNA-directed RNA polymerase specialized sigma24 family protein